MNSDRPVCFHQSLEGELCYQVCYYKTLTLQLLNCFIISCRLEYKRRRQAEGASKEEVEQELEEMKQKQEELDTANRGLSFTVEII